MGNLVPVTILFFVSLMLFHSFLLSEKLRRSGEFWHVVDYVWLLTATVALSFATVEVHRLRLSSSVDERRANARGELNGVRMRASGVWELQQAAYDVDGGRKGIDWFKKVSDELELGFDSFRWEIFVAQNYDDLISSIEYPESRSRYIYKPLWADYKLDPKLTNPGLIEEAKIIIRNLRSLSDEKSEISKVEAELKSNAEQEKPIKFMWPWFLCVALALRITKVTADLSKYQESRKEPTTKDGKTEDVSHSEPTIESDAP